MELLKDYIGPLVEKGIRPEDTLNDRIKKTALTLVPLTIGPAAFLWAAIYLTQDRWLSAAIPFSYSVISFFSVRHFLRTGHIRFLENSQLVLVLLLPFFLMWSLGGFIGGSVVMLWALFTPAAALMFYPKERARFWLLAYTALVLLSAAIDASLTARIAPLPETARRSFFLLNILGVSLGLYLLVRYSVDQGKKAFDNLSRLHAKRNLIINGSMDGFFVTNLEGRILDCNEAFLAMLGYSREELLARRIPDIEAIESDRDVAAHIAKILSIGSDRFDTRHRCKDGRLLDVEINATKAEVDGDIRLYAFVHDISLRKQTEASLLSAKEAAEHANAAKGEFLSRMSHELRTPLNAILGFANMLALPRKNHLTEQQSDSVQEILKAGNHLLRQVNEILDLARIDTGRIDLHLEPVPVSPLISECIGQLRPLLTEKNLRISESLPTQLAVMADRTRLKQVVLNLLSNAIKYNREGGEIHLAATTTNNRGLVEVRDTGRGIAQEKLQNLFKPFERLESSYDGIEGTGIGLALAKRLVDAMGGEIGANSQVGLGSTFWFSLVLADSSETPKGAIDGGGTMGAPKPCGGPGRILCIEDNPANLKLLKKMLGRRPQLVLIEAADAESGLALAEAHTPDLILLDINLPGMDGFGAMQRLKARPATAHIPVIAITANAMTRDVERGKVAGFADYLTKPLDLNTLLAAIDRFLPEGKDVAHEL